LRGKLKAVKLLKSLQLLVQLLSEHYMCNSSRILHSGNTFHNLRRKNTTWKENQLNDSVTRERE